LGATTATIAQEAGVANGTLFTYFETKAELLNHLYLELKAQMAAESSRGMTEDLEPRERFFHVWNNGILWFTANPEKRKTLAQLSVSEEITPDTRAAASKVMDSMVALLEQVRANGPLSDAPAGLVAEIMNALADATIDYILSDPDNAASHSRTGFDALWRVLGGS
jgi:AcrR family transcriptional regulator